jgi:phosphatidylserine/phosphatidylglycerophosphate/cardiolipin synthase-like enzyme
MGKRLWAPTRYERAIDDCLLDAHERGIDDAEVQWLLDWLDAWCVGRRIVQAMRSTELRELARPYPPRRGNVRGCKRQGLRLLRLDGAWLVEMTRTIPY